MDVLRSRSSTLLILIETPVDSPELLTQDAALGRLCRVDMGCLRFLHCIPDHIAIGKDIRCVDYGHYLGHHPGVDASFCGRHHLWYRC